jgi:hypothetical protein
LSFYGAITAGWRMIVIAYNNIVFFFVILPFHSLRILARKFNVLASNGTQILDDFSEFPLQNYWRKISAHMPMR